MVQSLAAPEWHLRPSVDTSLITASLSKVTPSSSHSWGGDAGTAQLETGDYGCLGELSKSVFHAVVSHCILTGHPPSHSGQFLVVERLQCRLEYIL